MTSAAAIRWPTGTTDHPLDLRPERSLLRNARTHLHQRRMGATVAQQPLQPPYLRLSIMTSGTTTTFQFVNPPIEYRVVLDHADGRYVVQQRPLYTYPVTDPWVTVPNGRFHLLDFAETAAASLRRLEKLRWEPYKLQSTNSAGFIQIESCHSIITNGCLLYTSDAADDLYTTGEAGWAMKILQSTVNNPVWVLWMITILSLTDPVFEALWPTPDGFSEYLFRLIVLVTVLIGSHALHEKLVKEFYPGRNIRDLDDIVE
jgi:hypothetical protein